MESQVKLNFPGNLVVKNLPGNAGDLGLITGLGKFPGEGNDNPLQYLCLVGYNPWGHRRVGHNLATKQINPVK